MRDNNAYRLPKVFGFAVREQDWPLAGLLAAAAGTEAGMTAILGYELDRSLPPADQQVSLGSLRALGRLLRAIARLKRGRG